MGPYTQRQQAALTEFEDASKAVNHATEFNHAYVWWTDIADRVLRLGLGREAHPIFQQYFG